MIEKKKYIHFPFPFNSDLKPQNLLLASEAHDAEVIVVDFGFAKVCDNSDRLTTYCGTLDFMAPEILSRKGPYGKFIFAFMVKIDSVCLLL